MDSQSILKAGKEKFDEVQQFAETFHRRVKNFPDTKSNVERIEDIMRE